MRVAAWQVAFPLMVRLVGRADLLRRSSGAGQGCNTSSSAPKRTASPKPAAAHASIVPFWVIGSKILTSFIALAARLFLVRIAALETQDVGNDI